jgi:hypothetical protein
MNGHTRAHTCCCWRARCARRDVRVRNAPDPRHETAAKGRAQRALNDRFGLRRLARDAVVVVLSDGWERADVDDLPQPQRDVRRFHRLGDDTAQLEAERLEADLVARAGRERLEGPLGVVATPVEATVD